MLSVNSKQVFYLSRLYPEHTKTSAVLLFVSCPGDLECCEISAGVSSDYSGSMKAWQPGGRSKLSPLI